MKLKTGRFTASEINYIYQNHDKQTVDQLARKLNRAATTIHQWIEKNIGLTENNKKEIEANNELRSRPYYRELQKQFSPDELEMFAFHFKRMWSQFVNDGVFHTEEMQILDAIKSEILMNRSLRNQQANADQIRDLEKDIRDEQNQSPPDQNLIQNLQRQIAVLLAGVENLSRDYKDHQARKSATLKELKGTRSDRIKQIEDSKQTFATLVTKLTVDPLYRKAIGIEMEKMRLAAQSERERLSKDITYEDGLIDKPLLNSDSVFVDD